MTKLTYDKEKELPATIRSKVWACRNTMQKMKREVKDCVRQDACSISEKTAREFLQKWCYDGDMLTQYDLEITITPTGRRLTK